MSTTHKSKITKDHPHYPHLKEIRVWVVVVMLLLMAGYLVFVTVGS